MKKITSLNFLRTATTLALIGSIFDAIKYGINSIESQFSGAIFILILLVTFIYKKLDDIEKKLTDKSS